VGYYRSASLSHAVYFRLSYIKTFLYSGFGDNLGNGQNTLASNTRQNNIILHIKTPIWFIS
jgi:hypothetical protein